MLLLIFGAIVLAVILLKKYVKPFQSHDKPKTDKEIVEEEVKRMVQDVDPETQAKMEEASKELEKKSEKITDKPAEQDIVKEEVNRSTRPIEDEAALKAMEEYAKAHPEEAAVFDKDEDKESDSKKK
jgi:flagellar biosynthesis/type III secretory pathway M-ring protein FliF/YscJ